MGRAYAQHMSMTALRRFFVAAQAVHRKGKNMNPRNPNAAGTRALVRGAIIAALYAATTLLFAPISYGEVQVRISESLTLLPVLLPEAVPALFVGCLLANILGGCTIFDIVFGSLATLLAAEATQRLKQKRRLAALMPVLFNGVIVGSVVHYAYAPVIPLPLCMVFVAAGEAVSCCALGPIVLSMLRRLPGELME